MRLPQRNKGGKYSLTELIDNAVLCYAILSYAWGADYNKITLAGLEKDANITKAGYKKL
jgi:hypothetical protein